MFIAVIDSSEEVTVQKQLDALNAVCDAFGTHVRIECDAPQYLDKFTKDLVNAKIIK